MRDSDSTTSWSDNLTFRLHYQDAQTRKDCNKFDSKHSISDTGLEDDLPDDFRVMHCSSIDLKALRSLPPTSLVLLLTPVLAPGNVPISSPNTESADPFEYFGRELSEMHHRLRHVPYVPKVGMTETHVAFIKQAAAVIVVICEPEDSEESLAHQKSFAKAVSDKRNDVSHVPFMLVRFNIDDDIADTDDADHGTVLYATSLTKRTSSEATQFMFKQEP